MKRQSGFTLVEFMVAMGVTLVVLAATMLAFKDAVRANQNVTQRGDMGDNLRAGMNLIEQDLIQAGSGIPTGGIPIPNSSSGGPCGVGVPPNRPNLTGGTTFPPCNVVLPAVEPGASLGPVITSPDANPGAPTDIITIMYADNTIPDLEKKPVNQPANVATGDPGCSGTISSSGNKVSFDAACVTLGGAGIQLKPGDLILFSNAYGNALQTVTDVSGNTLTFATGDAFNFNARTYPYGTIKNLQNTNCTTATPPVCTPNGSYPPTTVKRVWMVTYYLDNITDPTHVRLIRQLNFNTPNPVGETLENLQFTYNFVDGSTNPSNQRTVPTGLSENQIRAVNLFVGARSATRVGPKQTYLRNNFQTQVSLRSMAYVNRYQ